MTDTTTQVREHCRVPTHSLRLTEALAILAPCLKSSALSVSISSPAFFAFAVASTSRRRQPRMSRVHASFDSRAAAGIAADGRKSLEIKVAVLRGDLRDERAPVGQQNQWWVDRDHLRTHPNIARLVGDCGGIVAMGASVGAELKIF